MNETDFGFLMYVADLGWDLGVFRFTYHVALRAYRSKYPAPVEPWLYR